VIRDQHEQLERELECFYSALRDAARACAVMIVEIDKALGNRARRGRPRADDQGLLGKLAADYQWHFGERPSTTPGGTFANIATLLLQNLHGRAPRNVSRQVRAAIRSM
jgi:hypothetical protein